MKRIVTVTLAALAMATMAFGYKASKTIIIHQDKCDIATDLHFTAFQKETNIHIDNYTITVEGFTDVSTTPNDHGVGDGQIHGVDVNCEGGTIPYCNKIQVQIEFELSDFNTVRFEDVKWTYNGDTIEGTPPDTIAAGIPNVGFAVDYINPQKKSTYWFYNDDSVTVVVRNFRMALNQPAYLPPDQLFNFTGWTNFYTDFVVPPYSYIAIPLEGMEVSLYTFAAHETYIPGSAYNAEVQVLSSTEVHEDQTSGVTEPLDIEEMGLLKDTKILEVAAYPGYSEIKYQLPRSSYTNLSVYSLTGEKVATLVDEVKSAGGYTLRWEGDGLPVGLYIARLSADGIQASEKMIRLK